jgi:uncharacterized coiled-coil DUF342 family protein
MSSFDRFLNRAKDVADIAAQRTNEVVEISKLKIQALRLSNSIAKAYEELGSVYYNHVKYNGNSEILHNCVTEIDRLLKEQDELNQALREVGNKPSVFCSACGQELSADDVYCSRCGSAVSHVIYSSDNAKD